MQKPKPKPKKKRKEKKKKKKKHSRDRTTARKSLHKTTFVCASQRHRRVANKLKGIRTHEKQPG
jgi:hypothetical protein